MATVSPASITFGSCGDTPTLTVTPVGVGSADITLGEVSNSTSGTFDLTPARFTVNVASPPNTPPSISVTGVTGGASYEIGSVPVAGCSVLDAEDGPSTFPATLSDIEGPLAAYGLGTQTATCSYTDAGGLTASASETYGIVDTTNPVITWVSRTPANANGWNNGEVTVEWSCTDSGSGAVSASVSETVSAEGADQSVTGVCTDHAGNTASDTQTGINIDQTAPTLSPSVSPNPVVLGGSATATPNASDTLSGIDSASCGAPDTSSVGSKTVSCTATDLAGNSASADAYYSVIYYFTGFFRPVDNPPTWNMVKAGSAIPVKFSLSGNQGLDIFAPGFPVSQQIACDTSATQDVVEQTATAGSSSLSYDATTDQYIYVWKTDKGWVNTCRQLICN